MTQTMMPTAGYCWIHNVDEPDKPGDYLRCFECKHVYRKSTDLELAYIDNWPGPLPEGVSQPPKADSIYFCPLCLHDF